MTFHIEYKISPLRAIFQAEITQDNQEKAIQTLLENKPRAEIIKVVPRKL